MIVAGIVIIFLVYAWITRHESITEVLRNRRP